MDQESCPICYENEKQISLNCIHKLCLNCISKVTSFKCPLCRSCFENCLSQQQKNQIYYNIAKVRIENEIEQYNQSEEVANRLLQTPEDVSDKVLKYESYLRDVIHDMFSEEYGIKSGYMFGLYIKGYPYNEGNFFIHIRVKHRYLNRVLSLFREDDVVSNKNSRNGLFRLVKIKFNVDRI